MLNWCERWVPAIAAAVAFVAALAMQSRGWAAALSSQIDLIQVIAVAFNVVAFATPVTVALFAITLAPGGGFIQRLFGTKTYALFVDYVITALVLGVVALLVSAPFLVVKPETPASLALGYIVPLWWAVICAAGAAIGRVLLIFLVWARSYSHPKPVSERREPVTAARA